MGSDVICGALDPLTGAECDWGLHGTAHSWNTPLTLACADCGAVIVGETADAATALAHIHALDCEPSPAAVLGLGLQPETSEQ